MEGWPPQTVPLCSGYEVLRQKVRESLYTSRPRAHILTWLTNSPGKSFLRDRRGDADLSRKLTVDRRPRFNANKLCIIGGTHMASRMGISLRRRGKQLPEIFTCKLRMLNIALSAVARWEGGVAIPLKLQHLFCVFYV